MSAGEHRAWQALHLLRNEGVHVVRQHKIGRYTVDFGIRRARIAIEIDGGVHDMEGRAEYDAMRQTHLENIGWTFVRFRSEETHDAKARAALPLLLGGGGRGRGEPPAFEGLLAQEISTAGGSRHPPAPSSLEEGEIPLHLRRRTRGNRKLRSRAKP